MRAEWCYFKNSIDPTQCSELINYLEEKYPYQQPTIGFGEENKVDPGFRECSVAWVNPLAEEELVTTLWNFANRANRDFFDFDLRYINEIQFTKYEGDLITPGKYDWHHDVNWLEPNPHHRKLSLSLILSEGYTGGKFEFDTAHEQIPEEASSLGTTIAFPSFFTHRVNPVTSGTRYSIVTWVEGPKWR